MDTSPNKPDESTSKSLVAAGMKDVAHTSGSNEHPSDSPDHVTQGRLESSVSKPEKTPNQIILKSETLLSSKLFEPRTSKQKQQTQAAVQDHSDLKVLTVNPSD